MWNGKEENTQDPADTTDVRPVGRPPATCPSWCVEHDWTDVGHHRDEAVTHLGPVRVTRTPCEHHEKAEVQLSQVEFVNTGERWAVMLRVDDDVMPVADAARAATELAAVLTEEAARTGIR